MFKNITEEYRSLINAKNKIFKSLREKGLYLDQKDFNIMEVFNNAFSDYSDEEIEERKGGELENN